MNDETYRLPRAVLPRRYDLMITPDLGTATFAGELFGKGQPLAQGGESGIVLARVVQRRSLIPEAAQERDDQVMLAGEADPLAR